MTHTLDEAGARENLELGLANDPRSATPLAASAAKMVLTAMHSHRGDGIPTQYVHGPDVAMHAQTMWIALLTALRAASQAETKAVGEDVVERVAHDEMPPHLYARALEIVDEWEFEGSLTPTELVERLYRCFTRPPSPDTVTMLGDGPDER